MVLFPNPKWERVATHLQQAQHVWLVAHRSPDADAIGSQLALFSILESMGKKVEMINRDAAPRICMHLPNAALIQTTEHPNVTDVDTVVAVDAGSMARLGFAGSVFEGKTLINIDHHASNPGYGDINIVQPEYCATGAMIYDLAQYLHQPISSDAAQALYAAIITDTASFQLDRVDAKVHHMVAALIDAGVNPAQAANAIYHSQPLSRIFLLAMALQTLSMSHDNKVAWMHVNHHHLDQSGGDIEDTEGFIDIARSTQGVEIVIFIRPESEMCWKVSFRGKQGRDVGNIALQLNGGGHAYASGCAISGSLDEVYAKIKTVVDDSFAL